MLGQELVECKDNCRYIKDDRGKKFKRKAKHLTRVRITNYVKFGGKLYCHGDNRRNKTRKWINIRALVGKPERKYGQQVHENA